METCQACNGTGLRLAVNGGRWPGLSSTVPYKCIECDGTGNAMVDGAEQRHRRKIMDEQMTEFGNRFRCT